MLRRSYFRLDLTDCTSLSDVSIRQVMKLPRLKHLKVDHCKFSPNALRLILSKPLVSLSLFGTRLRSNSWKTVDKSIPTLKEVRIEVNDEGYNPILDIIAHLPNL